MAAINPRTSYPAAEIQRAAATPLLSTGAATQIAIPRTASGDKPAYIRVAISSGAAFVRVGVFLDTSTTAVTSDSIVTSSEALWLNTFGGSAVSIIQVNPGGVAIASVSACEEGAVRVPLQTSASGNTPGMG